MMDKETNKYLHTKYFHQQEVIEVINTIDKWFIVSLLFWRLYTCKLHWLYSRENNNNHNYYSKNSLIRYFNISIVFT